MEFNEQKESQKTEESPDQTAIRSVTRLLRNYPVRFIIGVVAALIVIAWVAPAAFIDLLKVLISWPLIAAILVISFRKEIAAFIQYLVVKYRTKGGDEFSLYSQAAARGAEASEVNHTKEPAPPDTQTLKDQIDKLIHIADEQTQEKQQIIQTAVHLLEQQREAVFYWWSHYLSYALVFKTKLVLSWFADQRTGISQEAYKIFWKQIIPEPVELEAVFLALFDHGLILRDGSGFFRVSEAGKAFLKFLRAKGFFGVPMAAG